MANTFKRKTGNSVGTTLTTIYTVPASTTTVMIGGVISNVTGTDADAVVLTSDGTNDISLIGADTPIPANTALSFIDGKIVLETGDTVKVQGSAANQLDVHLSIMEIT